MSTKQNRTKQLLKSFGLKTAPKLLSDSNPSTKVTKTSPPLFIATKKRNKGSSRKYWCIWATYYQNSNSTRLL